MQFPKSVLNPLTLGEPMTSDALTVYPVLGASESAIQLFDLDEALAQGWIEIGEVSESGNVPELGVINQSPHRVILFDGEELVGAKQNRIVNVTIVVAPFARLRIPVSCVEQGRWRWHSRHFDAGEFAYPSLRRDKFERVSQNLEMRQGFAADQGMIWHDIAAKSARMGVHSETGSMRDIGARHFIDDRQIQKEIAHQPRQVGYLAFIRDGFAGGDIFSSSEISARKFYKLVRTYYLDSRDPEAEFRPVPADEVMGRIGSSAVEPVESIGEGSDFRFRQRDIQGSLTQVGEILVHLAVFPVVRDGFRRPARPHFRVD